IGCIVDLAALRRMIKAVAPKSGDEATSGELLRRPSAAASGKPLVLVIHDDITSARLIERILDRQYTVVMTMDERSAMAECKSRAFAAVLCETRIRDGSGVALYRTVADFDP